MGWSAAAMVAATVYSASQNKAPEVAAAQATAAPQAATTPTAQSVQSNMANANGSSGGTPGVGATMLTGTGGVDPNTLNLQKNTLLGS